MGALARGAGGDGHAGRGNAVTGRGSGVSQASMRSLVSLAVVLAAAAIAGLLIAREPGSDLTKIVVGGWIAALGNVIGFYFGARSGG